MQEVTVVRAKGDKKPYAPISVVMAGVHGNEKCGIKAFAKVLPNLEVAYGKVYFVIGNPNALELGVRFTEFDLNRAFGGRLYSFAEEKSYEYKRAAFLRQYLDEATALLDIHSSPTSESSAFVICEPKGLHIAKHLPVSLVVHGFDKTNPGGTDYYMNNHYSTGICIECGQHDDPKAEEIAEKAIRTFLNLRHTGRWEDREMKPQQQKRLQVDSLYHLRSSRFSFAKPWKDFETVTKGSLIATDGEKSLIAKRDSFIVFARDDAKKAGDEAFYLGHEVKGGEND